MKNRQRSRAWARWLHLGCGVPVEHVCHVLDLPPRQVTALIAGSQKRITREEAEQWRRLHAEGVTIRAMADAAGRHRTTVSRILRRGMGTAIVPSRAPAKRPCTRILGQCARHLRTFHDLGYSPDRIATFLSLEASTVSDFLARLEPLRRCRVDLDRRVKPRGHEEERQARLALQRTKTPRQPEQNDKGIDEQRQRLALHRSPVDAWGPRGTAAEIADYARVVEAVREGRVSSAELLALASRAHYAEPRVHDEHHAPESMIWVGPADPNKSGPVKLSAEQIIEAGELLSAGASWTRVARRMGVSENTLRRCVTGVAPRRVPAQYPTEPVHYEHGIVRWDLPLGTAKDGTHRTVLVQCQCGRERYIEAHQVVREDRKFSAGCVQCCPFTPYVREPLLKLEQVMEAAALRSRGCSWLELERRFGVNRHTVRRAVERLLSPELLPSGR